MALVNRLFYSCAFGFGVTKTFQIDTAGTWVNNQSSVIYSGDGACYVYTTSSSISSPKQSYATEEYSNCSACQTANPDNLYYTFSSCCDNMLVVPILLIHHTSKVGVAVRLVKYMHLVL